MHQTRIISTPITGRRCLSPIFHLHYHGNQRNRHRGKMSNDISMDKAYYVVAASCFNTSCYSNPQPAMSTTQDFPFRSNEAITSISRSCDKTYCCLRYSNWSISQMWYHGLRSWPSLKDSQIIEIVILHLNRKRFQACFTVMLNICPPGLLDALYCRKTFPNFINVSYCLLLNVSLKYPFSVCVLNHISILLSFHNGQFEYPPFPLLGSRLYRKFI